MSLGIRSPSHRRSAVCISQSIAQEESTANDTDRNRRTSILTSIYVGIGIEPLKEYRRENGQKFAFSLSFSDLIQVEFDLFVGYFVYDMIIPIFPYTFSHLFPNCFVYVIIYLFISMLNYDFC